MDKYQIHKFSNKLLQKSVFSHLDHYTKNMAAGKPLQGNKFAPISINVDLTTGCNFNCAHCIDEHIINTGKLLKIDYIKGLIKNWSKNGLKSVILIGGGEPTLYPYFEDVVKFIKKLDLQLGIVSNGARIDRIEKIVKLLERKDWVRFSIDAGKNESFQRLHSPLVRITLEDVLVGAKSLRGKNNQLQIGYSFLVIGDDKYIKKIKLLNNIKEISLAAKLAKENGFSYISVKPYIDPEGARATKVSSKNLKEIAEEIKKSRKYETDSFKVIDSINLRVFYDKELEKSMKNQSEICHIQFFRLIVTPDGIFQCSLWRGFDNAKIIDANKKLDQKYYKNLNEKRLEILKKFNAKNICSEVKCLYSPFNSWAEKMIKGSEESAKPVEDFNDYFL